MPFFHVDKQDKQREVRDLRANEKCFRRQRLQNLDPIALYLRTCSDSAIYDCDSFFCWFSILTLSFLILAAQKTDRNRAAEKMKRGRNLVLGV